MNKEIERNINFKEVMTRIEKAKNNAFQKVNEELINLYWDVGKMLSIKIASSEWGCHHW